MDAERPKKRELPGDLENPDRQFRDVSRRRLLADLAQGLIGAAGWLLLIDSTTASPTHPGLRPLAKDDPSHGPEQQPCPCECQCQCTCACAETPCPDECSCTCSCESLCEQFGGNNQGIQWGVTNTQNDLVNWNIYRGTADPRSSQTFQVSNPSTLNDDRKAFIDAGVKAGGGENRDARLALDIPPRGRRQRRA